MWTRVCENVGFVEVGSEPVSVVVPKSVICRSIFIKDIRARLLRTSDVHVKSVRIGAAIYSNWFNGRIALQGIT